MSSERVVVRRMRSMATRLIVLIDSQSLPIRPHASQHLVSDIAHLRDASFEHHDPVGLRKLRSLS